MKNASTPSPTPSPSPRRRAGKASPAQPPAADTGEAAPSRPADTACPVVGIGASAGGLEAMEQFFSHAPDNSGLAFVVVQHLDPSQDSMLVQLLQRTSAMPVTEVVDGQKVLPNHIYVIPPSQDLALLHGVLYLMEPTKHRGIRLPIDHFLRSLAADLCGNAIGVILSGMGSDGTLGLRAIKENAGTTFVQAPASAKFDSMPRSAIDAGLADVVAPAEELVPRILAFSRHAPALALGASVPAKGGVYPNLGDIDKVLLLLREQTGNDFSLYRKSTLVRRIARRMCLHQLTRTSDYVRLLRESKTEANLLFQEVLIGVTSFFRDPAVWEQIKTEVMPALLATRPQGGVLRAWVPGCSTGEEAYGLAMLFKEALEEMSPRANLRLKIFATDLDKTAIDVARNGIYPPGISADVSEQRLRRFFVENGTSYRIGTEIRDMVVFAPQNLAVDPPFTRLDLLSCRNLLIYLEPELQQKLISLFHYSLNPGGVLLLGNAETVGAASKLFALRPGEARLYRRLDGRSHNELGASPPVFTSQRPAQNTANGEMATVAAPPQVANLKQLADDLLLERFAPAAVLATASGDIVYVSGKTGRFLEPAVGKASLNLLAMAREGLDRALAEGFHRAMRDKLDVTVKDVSVSFKDENLRLNVHVQPIHRNNLLQGLALVVFEALAPRALSPSLAGDSEPDDGSAQRLVMLQKELQRVHEDLQATREEMQTSQEELKSMNEELQSTNEELQSTNEELTTSKEEMQSMNEELQTVNHELMSRVEQVVLSADDMNNLLNSTQVATLFLDAYLGVRRFTPAMAELIKLIPTDVGRPITDLVSTLQYPQLADDAREVLRSLVASVREVPASDNRWYAAHLMPYRTQDNRIDGVVITFTEMGAIKALESTLQQAQALLAQHTADPVGVPDVTRELANLLRQAQTLLDQNNDSQALAFVRAGASLRSDITDKKRPARSDQQKNISKK